MLLDFQNSCVIFLIFYIFFSFSRLSCLTYIHRLSQKSSYLTLLLEMIYGTQFLILVRFFFFSPTIQGKIKGDLLREDGDGKLEMLHECMTQTTHLDCEHKNLRYY
jgi:hypothetical protein